MMVESKEAVRERMKRYRNKKKAKVADVPIANIVNPDPLLLSLQKKVQDLERRMLIFESMEPVERVVDTVMGKVPARHRVKGMIGRCFRG
jgi:hypothetical protein